MVKVLCVYATWGRIDQNYRKRVFVSVVTRPAPPRCLTYVQRECRLFLFVDEAQYFPIEFIRFHYRFPPFLHVQSHSRLFPARNTYSNIKLNEREAEKNAHTRTRSETHTSPWMHARMRIHAIKGAREQTPFPFLAVLFLQLFSVLLMFLCLFIRWLWRLLRVLYVICSVLSLI